MSDQRTLDALRGRTPAEWVVQALDATGTASLRRRLPAEQVVWLVSGMALFRDRSIAEVAERDVAAPSAAGSLS